MNAGICRKKERFGFVQWFKMGDHPDVTEIPEHLESYIPVISTVQGYIDGYFVSPGDYIIIDEYKNSTVIDQHTFLKMYEVVNKFNWTKSK